jgi:hypothetical protein
VSPKSKRRWDKQKVVKAIADLKARGGKLNQAEAARHDLGLYYAGRAYFGSWEKAITAAGLDYNAIRRSGFWNRARVIEQIRARKRAGLPLHVSAVEKDAGRLTSAAGVYCGSWGKAIEAAGFDYAAIKRQKEWPRPIIVSEIRRIKREGVDISTTTEVRRKYRILHAAAIRHFGSWRAALKSAGLEKLYWRSTVRP